MKTGTRLYLAALAAAVAFLFLFPALYRPSDFEILRGTVRDARLAQGFERQYYVTFRLAEHGHSFTVTRPDIGIWKFEKEPTAAEMLELLKPGTPAAAAVFPGALDKLKAAGPEPGTIRAQALALDGWVIFDRYGAFEEEGKN